MKTQRSITALMGLLVFVLFALCLLLVLLTGANIYSRLSRNSELLYSQRTISQYLTTRVRQAESVDTGDFGGCDTLIFREEIGSEAYVTRVYCHNGFLQELFTSESAAFSPEDGEKLLEAENLTLETDGSRLEIRITFSGGAERHLTLYPRNGREVSP